MMNDLHRLLESEKFESLDDLLKYVENLKGKKIPTVPKKSLNAKQQAQDLVYAAQDLSQTKAKVNIEKALELDPDCIEAYEYLGSVATRLESASMYFEKGIAIGRRIFGGKYLEESKGVFWGLHETRPFMRCLANYSNCLYTMGKKKECVAVMEEIIKLNNNDNIGVRDQLLLYLIELNEDKKFIKYAKMFEEDFMSFALFNRALFAFKSEGETENSKKLLQKALQQNKFVAKRLLSYRPIKTLTDYYGLGDENEADYYVSFAKEIWANIKGAKEWLKKHAMK